MPVESGRSSLAIESGQTSPAGFDEWILRSRLSQPSPGWTAELAGAVQMAVTAGNGEGLGEERSSFATRRARGARSLDTGGLFCDTQSCCRSGFPDVSTVPKWRNWQTRMVQVHVLARVWRFKSSLRHQNSEQYEMPRGGLSIGALLRPGLCCVRGFVASGAWFAGLIALGPGHAGSLYRG